MCSNLTSKRKKILDCYRKIIPNSFRCRCNCGIGIRLSVNSHDMNSLADFIIQRT